MPSAPIASSADKSDIAVSRGVVLVNQVPMVAKLSPSVGDADEADGPGEERRTPQHGQVRPTAKCRQNVVPLVFTKLAVVVRPGVDEMQAASKANTRSPVLEESSRRMCRTTRSLRGSVSTLLIIRNRSAAMRARRAESGNPVFDTFDDRLAVALLDLGEESIPVGDDEPDVADAKPGQHVDSRFR